ncbi:hypothetical protein FDZ71_07125 [bacterium]|nr:MAG: hypothetical protein FDZ71_07125 [bacterium]
MDDEKREYVPSAELPVKETALPEDMRFLEIETPADKSADDQKPMTLFVPQGYSTPTWIHIGVGDEKEEYTLIVNPLTGRTEIKDGREAMPRKGI